MRIRKQKILFVTGSMNQTSQMHQIAAGLTEFDCWFSQIFTDSKVINYLIENTTWVNGTALAGQFRTNSENFFREHNLQIDYGAHKNQYDLVVYCSDMIIPMRMRKNYLIWVQEGMVDKYNLLSKMVKTMALPTYVVGNTSLNGASNICDIYCAASEGYKNYFAKKGTDPSKIVVTGMPNYDNLKRFKKNTFPHKDYVMVATTDLRETYRFENRPAFIKKAVKVAAGRPLLFKLHPNENIKRAEKEIRKYAPADAMIYTSGNTNEMIANCCELITQYSTVVYTGIALGKKVHSWFDVKELQRLAPKQNGGTSAKGIADICKNYLERVEDIQQIGSRMIADENNEPLYKKKLVNNWA